MTALPPPVLASTLYTIAKRKRESHRQESGTSIKPVDQFVLNGSFNGSNDDERVHISERGVVVGLAVEKGWETWVAELRSNSSRDQFVHAGGYTYTKSIADEKTAEAPEENVGRDEALTEAQAREALDRLSISRIFDIEGLMEVLVDIQLQHTRDDSNANIEAGRDGVTGHCIPPARSQSRGNNAAVMTFDVHIEEHSNERGPEQRQEIADSQMDDPEDAPIPWTPTQQPNPPSPHPRDSPAPNNLSPLLNNNTTAPEPASPSQQQPSQPPPESTTAPPTLLLIPNIHTLISPLIRQNPTQGHAQLSHLLRRLHVLSSHHNITIILGNTTVTPPFSTTSTGPHRQQSGAQKMDESPSAFEDIRHRPALGRGFNFGIDVSLMVSGAPGRKRVPEEREVVVECLHDRCADREGQWVVLGFREDEIVRITE
ncbi:MAG: hypothetical protein Q9159_005644 [Coniocarpon cinnabarinum]